MITYKLNKGFDGMPTSSVNRYESDSTLVLSIPFAPDNTDYAEFKKAVTAGAELQDADGNVMTTEAAQAFVSTLP